MIVLLGQQINVLIQSNKNKIWADLVNDRIWNICRSYIVIYTDGSNDLKSDKMGFVYAIPELGIYKKQRTSDHLAVYTVEMLAVLIPLQWVEQNKIERELKCSDSLSSLTAFLKYLIRKSLRTDVKFIKNHV